MDGIMTEQVKCKDCRWYNQSKGQCHESPMVVEKLTDDWCSRFEEKEEVVCPVKVEEKEKASPARVKVKGGKFKYAQKY